MNWKAVTINKSENLSKVEYIILVCEVSDNFANTYIDHACFMLI